MRSGSCFFSSAALVARWHDMHGCQMDDTPPSPIPRDLHCEYEDRPFRHCTRCGETLHDDHGGFQISKAYKNGECVMEYALCDHCRTTMMEEFSQESKKRLSEFQDDHVDLERGLQHCSVCGQGRDGNGTDDYVITGICEHESLLHSIMICGSCADGVQGVLSSKTKDTWRRFVDENFPGPPSEGEIPELEYTSTSPLPVVAVKV